MQSNNFRVGNFIQATHEIEIDKGNGIIEDVETTILLKIRGVDLDNTLVDGSCTFSLEEVDTDYQIERFYNLEPIPLTEEWLLKFGFEETATAFSCNKFNFYYREDKKYIPVLHGYTANELLEIKHVHELQNLYFALTGTELKINKQQTLT